MKNKDERTEQVAPASGSGEDLRRRAKERLRKQSLAPGPASPEEVERLLYELQVHQIELEMQNEELRRVQQELEASRARYFDLYDLAPVGYLTLGRHGLILEANLTAAQMLGIERTWLAGQPVTRLIDPVDQDIYYLHRKRLSETGARQRCDVRMVRRDGGRFWARLEMTVTPDSEGRGGPVCRTVMSDITERKEIEAALVQSEKRHRSFIELTEQLGWTTNANGEVVEDIPSWRRFTGQRREEVMGWGWSKAVHLDDLEHVVRVWRKTVQSKQNYETEYRVRRYDGVYRHLLARGVPILREDGEVLEWVGTCIDITERKVAEDALQNAHDELEQRVRDRTSELSSAIESLEAEVSRREQVAADLRESESQVRRFASQCLTAHEEERGRISRELHDSIAAYLAAIRFSIEKAQDEIKNGEACAPSLQDAISAVKQTTGEVRRIMANLRPSILDDLGVVVAISWFCRQFHETYSHIRVEPEVDLSEEEVPDSLKTVVFRIMQEAMNNVAKHSKATRVSLSLRKSALGMELTIRDNGRGFDPVGVFGRKRTEGGLGLPGMRERAELSGGHFSLESGAGEGTTIRTAWPVT